MEAGGKLSSKEFSGNWSFQIQNDIYRQVAVQNSGESISRNDNQVCCLKSDITLGNAAQSYKVVA